MNDQQKLEQLLSEEQYMSLAITLDDGTPWVVPIRIKRRGGNEFEWDSSLASLHSKMIVGKTQAAITIFQKNEDSQIGFYAKGTAELVEELKPGFGCYKFVAEKSWINDETFVKREVTLPIN